MSINLDIFRSKFNLSKKTNDKTERQAVPTIKSVENINGRILENERIVACKSERYANEPINTGGHLHEITNVSSEDYRILKENYEILKEEVKQYRRYKEIVKAVSELINIQIENGILEAKKNFASTDRIKPPVLRLGNKGKID
jgi:hypothetical protein